MISRAKVSKADAVLAVLNELISEEDKHVLYLEMYSNGREQGYHIKNFDNHQAVSFSENRCSDQIVVYRGSLVLFNMQGNVPNKEIYEHAKYFKYNEYTKAAQYIHSYLSKENCDNETDLQGFGP